MKLEIYDVSVTEVNPPIRLRLRESGDDIEVVVVNALGSTRGGGHILSFRPDGRIFRHHGVSPSLGFDLDDSGRVNLQ